MMYYNKISAPDPFGSIILRLAQPGDRDGLRRVAQRDTRSVPDGELLVALDGGEVRAAIGLSTGEVIADPFHHTRELVRMLSLRRSQLEREMHPPRSGFRPLRLASS